jgi:hypothetical protein
MITIIIIIIIKSWKLEVGSWKFLFVKRTIIFSWTFVAHDLIFLLEPIISFVMLALCFLEPPPFLPCPKTERARRRDREEEGR